MDNLNPSTVRSSRQNIFGNMYNAAVKLPLVRSRHFSTPPYHIGSLIENRLGLQVYRTIGKGIARTFRKRRLSAEIKHYVSVMNRDGVLVIENFLEPKQFEKVLFEYERANAGVAMSAYRGVENARLHRSQTSIDDLGSPFWQ